MTYTVTIGVWHVVAFLAMLLVCWVLTHGFMWQSRMSNDEYSQMVNERAQWRWTYVLRPTVVRHAPDGSEYMVAFRWVLHREMEAGWRDDYKLPGTPDSEAGVYRTYGDTGP